MPASEHEPSDALTPATPDGYAEPATFRYSIPAVVGIVAVLTPVAALLFGGLLWYAQGPAGLAGVFEVRETATTVSFAVRSSVVAAAFLGSIVVVTVLHEAVHGLVAGRYGYRVSYGVAPNLGAFYAAAFHQFQAREHVLVVAVAPLVVLDLLALPALFAPSGALAFAAFVALVFNTAGAAGDIYLVARLLRMPDGTLLYDADLRHSYVFVPADERSEPGPP